MPTKCKETPEIKIMFAAIPAMVDCRFLVSFDHEGKAHVILVPPDASVMTKKEMLEAINKGVELDTNMLAEFAIATVNNLKSRCDYVNSLRPVNEV